MIFASYSFFQERLQARPLPGPYRESRPRRSPLRVHEARRSGSDFAFVVYSVNFAGVFPDAAGALLLSFKLARRACR
jgi:hypothetical protein